MKRSLLIALFILIGIFFFVSESPAQDVARIAFVNSDRSAILAKTVGSTKVDTIFTSGIGKNNVVKVRNLSILASSADSKSLLIAGYFIYPNQASGLPDSVAIFARIDSPFTNVFGFNGLVTPNTVGGAKILKVIDRPEANFTKTLPLGCITSDALEWYGIWDKAQGGNGKVWFYHGRFDGKGAIDSVTLEGSDAAGGGYHMTNMITTLDNTTMLTVLADAITERPARIRLINWTPGTQTFTPIRFDALIQSKQGSGLANPDWAFGFYLHILPIEGNGIVTAELALDVDNSGNLKLYKLRVQNSSILDLTYNSRELVRANIPLLDGTDVLHFFTGNTGNPGSDLDDHEVVVPDSGSPMGNGGDLMPSSGGDSVVFITCTNDNFARTKASGIYIYDLQTNKVTQVQSDETKMERQPIFLATIHKPLPYQPGVASADKSIVDFGSVHVGGANKTLQATLTATNSSLVIVTNQTKISGPDAGIFTFTPVIPASGTTVKGHNSLTFNITFAPSAGKTYSDTLIIHYQDSLQKGEKDSIIAIALTGVGSTAGVATSTPSTFDLSVVPNPFAASTSITVTAREASSTSIEIRDLLGKDIYSSKVLKLAEGEKFTYTLDANALHLAPGTYFVIVRSGGEEATRQIIYIK